MTSARHPHILSRAESLLVVVDMQEPFLGVIHGRERLTAHVLLLAQAAQILGVPVLSTTQYAARMGETVPEVAAHLPAPPLDKMTFSCAGSAEFSAALEQTGRRQIVLAGVETHICVAQTALDLAARGYQVQVSPDAVSARSIELHKLGMERIRDSGVLPVAAESAVYEWLAEAGTPEFKAILKLVKSL